MNASETFDGPVPPPQMIPELLSGGLGFQNMLADCGTPNLTATIAIEVIGCELCVMY